MDVGKAVVSSLITVGEFFMVDAEEVEDGGIEIVDVDRVLGDVVAPIVGLTVCDAAFYSTAGHPD